MRRFWHAPSRYLPAPAPPARTRLVLEALEDRYQPSALTPNQTIVAPFSTAQVQPSRFVVATPNPMTLVGKTAEMSFLEEFQITAMQQAADGSFTFTGTFAGHAVAGVIGARSFGGPLLTTGAISFSGSWFDSDGLRHRVQYTGTLNMDWNRVTTWGTLNRAYENTGADLLLEGPWHNEPPRTVSTTFV
jgi:hypothetical protein